MTPTDQQQYTQAENLLRDMERWAEQKGSDTHYLQVFVVDGEREVLRSFVQVNRRGNGFIYGETDATGDLQRTSRESVLARLQTYRANVTARAS